MTTIFHIICLMLKFSSTFTIDIYLENETENTTDGKSVTSESTHKAAAKFSFEDVIANVSANDITDKVSYFVMNSIKNSAEYGYTNSNNRINVTHSISENYVTELNQNYFANSTLMNIHNETSTTGSFEYFPTYFPRSGDEMLETNALDHNVDNLEIVSESNYIRQEDFPFNLTEIENETLTESSLVLNKASNKSNETYAPVDLFNGDDRKTLINDDDKFDSQNITENEREEQSYACADCTSTTDGIHHDTSYEPRHVKRNDEKSMYAYRGNSIHKQHINGNVLSSTENVLAISSTFQDKFTQYPSSTEGVTYTENILNYLHNGDVGIISRNDDKDIQEKYENVTITNASFELDVMSVIPTNGSLEQRELEDISSGDYSTDIGMIADTVSGSSTSNYTSSEMFDNGESVFSTESNMNSVYSVNGIANLTDTTWPVRHSAVVEGDLILGGLMMVHSREDTITCGPIMPQGGIQALEAMLFTIDRINEIGLLPNIKLGAHILDDCDKDTYGLEMAVDFIKDLFIENDDVSEIEDVESFFWPVKKEAIMEGDLILGGLMMVHSREDTMMCGPIMPQGGIQALEAMLYTLDRINEDGLLPNIRIGAHILDDCDRDSYGLEMAVDFIKGSISNIDGAEYHCNKTQVRKVISGVVGAASSVTSIQVANLLRLFRIPQVSFFSTSPELSNKQRFEYFSRTIPSDHYQVKAMVDIVRRMGWSYISIIYEESNYGIKAFEELEDLLAKHDICIAVKEKLVKDSGVAEEIAYDNIVQKLLTKPRARGAIIFGSDQEVREVMLAVRRNNATGAFSWIGSDGWSARNLVSDGNEPEVEGTLSVQPQANPVMGFEKHFLGLTVENNRRNPWFVEFWEDHFKCRYPNSSLTPYNKKYTKQCTTKEKLSKDATAFEDQLQFVSDAVMAFAYALSDMHKALCKGRPGLCDAMKPTKGADLLKYLRKVNFIGLSGDRFHFDSNGDGPARYNIIHFKQVSTGNYKWVKVGEYYEGELRLNMTEVQFKFHQPKPPESVCSLPCERGQAKKYVEGESCCWHCFNCTTYQIRHKTDETQCVTCRWGTIPDRMKEKCVDIPEQFLRPESGWAIGAMAFSSTGILITMFVVGVFLRHNETPVVRASGRELSYVLLAGILMCYSVTFALVLRPTNFSCGIQRFGAGFCFTVVYAALLTKTNRISRIFKHGKQSAKRPSFISPRSQLVICSGLTSIQLIINGIWMVISPAYAEHYYPTREDNLLICDSYIDASYMIAFFYPILLIVVCTIYAVLTRKIPEAFNESKHIGFTMYTTCVIWLAFVPLYFGTANHVPLRITSMSVTISLSASVTLACLFSPKLYIILIRPERNVRQSMMPVRYSAINKTTGTGPSSMMAAIMVTAATCNQGEKIEKHVTPPAISNCESPSKKDENGSVRFVEIATQTVTNLLTNYNKSLTNCHNVPFADNHQNTNVVTNIKPNNSSTNFIDNNNKVHNNPTATTSPTINNINGQVGNNADTTTNSTAADAVDNSIELRL